MYNFEATAEREDIWNRKAVRSTRIVALRDGAEYEAVYDDGEWQAFAASHVDLTDLIPGKKALQALKAISLTVDQVRTVEYGNVQEYKVYEFDVVYDLVNGEVKNLQTYQDSRRYTGKDIKIELNTQTRKEIETRTCLLGGFVCP